MEFEQVLHMVGGEGENSYATNSIVQKRIISKARPFLLGTIKQLLGKTQPQCFKIAELGCSSGPNSLLVISDIINTIVDVHQNLDHPLPEFQVFLNDLPGNDFNTMFKSIPFFYDQVRKAKGGNSPRCFLSAVPGSFYECLFPTNALSFVHSSSSVHWLSQVPKGIESNKENIYMAKTSPPCVLEAYMEQFERDFTLFLGLRSREIRPDGLMVVTVTGRRSSNPTSNEICLLLGLLARSLLDMVSLGLVEEAKLHSFNIPFYNPSAEEIRSIVEVEGSFHLNFLETFDVNYDSDDDPKNEDVVFNNVTSGKNVANCIRAVTESLIEYHFGKEIIEELFSRYANYVGEHMMNEKFNLINFVMSFTKKG